MSDSIYEAGLKVYGWYQADESLPFLYLHNGPRHKHPDRVRGG